MYITLTLCFSIFKSKTDINERITIFRVLKLESRKLQTEIAQFASLDAVILRTYTLIFHRV